MKFHPALKLRPEWTYPCLWWSVSYYLQVFARMKFCCLAFFAGMKFHPSMNSFLSKNRDEISSRNEQKKKMRKHFRSFTMNMVLFYFFIYFFILLYLFIYLFIHLFIYLLFFCFWRMSVLNACAKFRGSCAIVGLVDLVPSCLRGFEFFCCE